MLRDIRFAFRTLASRPLFTLVASLSLALGIGANSAIFGLIDGLWFRPLAVPHSGEIVRVFSVTDQDPEAMLSYPEYLDIQRQATSLKDVVAIGGRGGLLMEGDSHPLFLLNLVSSNFFTSLGVQAELGRVFTPHDEVESPGALVTVLGNSFWHRRFGGDPNIIGRQIRIQRMRELSVTVVGVLPASFREIDNGSDRDMWFPRQTWAQLGDVTELERRSGRWFHVLGRLAPGSNVKTANAQIEALAHHMAEAYPDTNRGRRASVVGDLSYRIEQAGGVGEGLLAIVLLVVAICSVNVANLLLSRAGIRGREMAVRLALGAARGRLIRMLMIENFLLGAAGLILGLAMGFWLISTLPALMVQPPGMFVAIDFQFDSRVLVFSILVSLATVLFFGLAPACRGSRPDLVPALKGEAAFGLSHGRWWPLRNWLVVIQVAVSLVIVASAGILVRSFANTRVSDLGFGRKPLLNVFLAADGAKPALYRDIISRFEGMPGVKNVAVAVRAPLSLSGSGMSRLVRFPDRPELANAPPMEIKYNSISANFLSTMGTPILKGRGFETRDENPGTNAVLINETMARRFWPSEDALNKIILLGGREPKAYRVVGIVKNAPINAIGEPPEPYLYLDYWANFEEEMTFMIETREDPASLAQPVRRALKSVDSRIDPLSITTQNELINFSAFRYQVTAEVVGALGMLGLILTAVGLYGVVSFGVSQRTRELGIRMALGADRRDALGLVLRDVLLMGAAGLGVGLPLALTATRLFSSLLFGIRPWDVPTFLAAAVVPTAVLLSAGFLPARRATGIEPSSALRVV
ncbi:MAG TPA: ABC transporter permease [Bryobacteraceae bacterium]|nr:ABC transporter permease [Bryobacteraceae bacterium]